MLTLMSMFILLQVGLIHFNISVFQYLSSSMQSGDPMTIRVNFGQHVKIKMRTKTNMSTDTYIRVKSPLHILELRKVNSTFELVHYERVCTCNDFVSIRYQIAEVNDNMDDNANMDDNDNDVTIDIEFELKPKLKYIIESIVKGEYIDYPYTVIVTVNNESYALDLNITDLSTRFKIEVANEIGVFELVRLVYLNI